MGYYWDGGNPPNGENKLTECDKMKMFIEDNPEIAIKFMIWEDKILKQDNDGTTDVTNIDFDIID